MLNIVRIDGSGEMIINGSVPITAHIQKHIQYELMYVRNGLGIATKLRIILADVMSGISVSQNFLLEQITFIQK